MIRYLTRALINPGGLKANIVDISESHVFSNHLTQLEFNMSQEVWIPIRYGNWVITDADLLDPAGNMYATKITIPDNCPFCAAKIPIGAPGSSQECFSWVRGGDVCKCVIDIKFKNCFGYMWAIRLEPKEAGHCDTSVASKNIGGNCKHCGLPNEYQTGPYTCFSCRQDPYR